MWLEQESFCKFLLVECEVVAFCFTWEQASFAAVEQMTDCIIEIHDWMKANLLWLNDSKTEFMVPTSRHIENKLGEDVRLIKVGKAKAQGTSTARNLGVIMDSRLNMLVYKDVIKQLAYKNKELMV